ncbi:MAG: ABC transporter permease [Clostridiales bacterium]|nr:ABC transporter permease [Clostridiales bacterium]
MLRFISRRLLVMIPMVLLISVIVFFVIQLPPGDFMSSYIAKMEASNEVFDQNTIARMRAQYGLDQPWYVQYAKWIAGILTRGDFGYSFSYNRPVWDVLSQRMGTTLAISLTTMAFTYLFSIPAGIYSAVKQYSFGDYLLSVIGFLGMGTPNFLFAIILMVISYNWFGDPMLGLVSQQFVNQPMSWAKLLDILKHMIIPVIVIGTANTCGLIRTMRSQLLDEISRPYVLTARAKGLSEKRILYKYCVRAALNPIASTIGWSLTSIFTGSTISAIVMNLPTQGPLLHQALLNQDMYLAGSWLLLMTVMILLGTILSDILLAWLDPRIRYVKAR